jgi:hypothetical protein
MSTDAHANDEVQGTRKMGTRPAMATDTHRHLAMLRILYGASATALEAFRAADNPIDDQLMADLETMVERTKGEIERLTAHLAKTAS